MGESSGTRLEGDRYQHLYSWYEILRLLDDASPFEAATIEHPHAGAADDLTLHAKAGSGARSRFVQVKWHVDHRGHYSFDFLIRAEEGERSLLKKLFDSWRVLKAGEPIEVWLVSNWAPAPHPDLGPYIDGRSLSLLEAFFSGGGRSKVGRTRRSWQRALGATEEEVQAFCRDLRFHLGFSSITTLEEQLDDRMAHYGLRLGKEARSIARDEIAERIELGGGKKRLTRADILEIIDTRGLRARHPDDPPARLWIQGWARQAWDRPPSAELDWTEHFDRDTRRVPSPEVWESKLLPDLRQVRDDLARRDAKYIDFRGKLPLSAVLAVGSTFPQVGGFKFRAEQPTAGDLQLWRSDVAPTERRFVIKTEDVTPGPDVVVGLAVTGDGLPDLRRFHATIALGPLVYAEPDVGVGPAVLKSAGDAVGLAMSAKQILRDARAKYGAARIHLVPYGPATLFLFLGQVLNALGPLVVYERTADGGYKPGVALRTG
ncbi:SAVED domain-containing protein [Anaeromyxobacter dehalogenans]|uniref:SMODS-associated and fused to various effectors domain-containing protein n=1 Tax=Anaeromyxobacter dehalogenans (strain 2CP-C) TaxID=290397 RepID=Q2IIN2_ANADE|nr:SAVED domain-containing protein [Anaeromyxobacter dehalogenans]ABC81514.1 hypothetical protein Adeh_1741 [Anaeromyxobacter dehalogenans 2CP-C]